MVQCRGAMYLRFLFVLLAIERPDIGVVVGMDEEGDRVSGCSHRALVCEADSVRRGAVSAAAPVLQQVADVHHDGAGDGASGDPRAVQLLDLEAAKLVLIGVNWSHQSSFLIL